MSTSNTPHTEIIQHEHDPVIPKQYLFSFCLVTTLFAFWGFANDVTNPLVRAFQEIFLISSSQSSLVQTAFYGGYATMAIPAALFIRKFSYKAGILVGLALYATGALLFIPASITMAFWVFLAALYILTFGLAFLETTANPYILAMGPPSTATRRLNFAQAFNPIGSLIGMVVASQIVLAGLGIQEFRAWQADEITSAHKAQYEDNLQQYKQNPQAYQQQLTTDEQKLETLHQKMMGLEEGTEAYKDTRGQYKKQLESLKDRQMVVDGEYVPMMPGRIDAQIIGALHDFHDGKIQFDVKDAEGRQKYTNHAAMQSHDLMVVRWPYVVIGCIIVGAFVVFLVSKLPEASAHEKMHLGHTFAALLGNGRYVGGVIAQTFYVAAQIMCWTFIINYAVINLNLTLSEAQGYNIIAMIIFCSSRFICTYLLKYIKPGALLMILAVGGMLTTLGAIFLSGFAGLYSLIAISACMSLMFPTIYGIALDGLGEEAKLGSAGLIFAIVGGALMPPLQGRIIDAGDDITGMIDVGFTSLPSVSASFVLPLICFVVIAIYGFYTNRYYAE